VSEEEQKQVQAGLHIKDAFALRRCQILLASARGERATVIAEQLTKRVCAYFGCSYEPHLALPHSDEVT
jgi:hypothetical protein